MVRPICPLMVAIAAVAWVLIAGRGSAQMGYQACSLEWLVADSDVVVRASVSKVERVPIPNPEPKMYREPEDWRTVTLTVHETLKGDRAESLAFTESALGSDRIYEGWKDAGREQLWFLVRDKERGEGDDAGADRAAARSRLKPHGGGWSVIRLGPPVPEERGFVSMPPPIFTMDLNVREKPKDILEAARGAVAEGGKRGQVQGHGIDLPRGVMQRSGRSGDANSLCVPIDRRLEGLARRLIGSSGDFLPEAERTYADQLRLEGVRALRHFSSEKNVALLKTLLEDPAWSIHVSPAGTREKVYDLREAAYETLRSWGILLAEPVLREGVPRP